VASPAFRSTANSTGSGTTLQITKPSGVSADDILVAWINDDSAATLTPPSGWTAIGETGRLRTYYYVAGASEPATYTWSSSVSGAKAGSILAYSGGDTSVPVDVSSFQTNVSSTTMTCPSITTTATDTTLVFGGATYGSNPSPTFPGGSTVRVGFSSNNVGLQVGDEAKATAGSTGTRSVTLSVAATSYAGTISIRGSTSISSGGGSSGNVLKTVV
jgi:hypothetical protein